ncbi:hypothetical protein [Macrococcus armenti]|uniref:hypothetical protein n=1 Tax=Macrococcus armenti TaxID=2875764 RepID=UPI001CCC53E7|nr:hypothetical protein [Macrococcus armenti]UBH08445.1 hypothetical protein LAU41_10805 [Macrococcus armenti]UBH10731.1 hypothetical protein LAU38_11005 [Macrococcus armenti]
MISVFYAYTPKIQVLYKTLLNYNKNQTLILYDNGFLPKEIITPYNYFSDNININGKPLFYNEVKVPKLWQIEGTHKEATIYDGSKVRGKIRYTDFSNSRIVRTVEWFNSNDELISVDYYNNYGLRFAEELYDEGKKVLIRHFNEKKKK